MAEVRLGPLSREHRARLQGILVSTNSFSDEEVGVALELFDCVIPSNVEESASGVIPSNVEESAPHEVQTPRLPSVARNDPDTDYEFIGAFVNDTLTGYACFGPTPATDGTWDLYWLAVDPAAHGRGIGRALVQWVEKELGRRGARLLVVETSSRADYEQTRSFYARGGYVEAARVKDFYSTADDRIIFTTRLSGEAGVQAR